MCEVKQKLKIDLAKLHDAAFPNAMVQFGETVVGGNWLEETTALTGQYGHSGKLQAVTAQDNDMMDRIKFLAGITK